MKRMTVCAIAVALASASAGGLRAGEARDVYLLAGQSNMDGRGKAADLTDPDRAAAARAIVFYRNPPFASDGWQALGPGFSVPPGYKAKTLPSTTFGPEIGFALGMLKEKPDMKLSLIKASKGGTSLSKDWKPGVKGQPATQGPCYTNFIATVAAAKEALAKKGDTMVIRGLLWHQGESDAGSPSDEYLKRLSAFASRVREDLGLPDLPIAVGEVYDNGKRDNVRDAQRRAEKEIPHTVFVPANELKTWDNGTHFDAASQLKLGARFADAMLKIR